MIEFECLVGIEGLEEDCVEMVVWIGFVVNCFVVEFVVLDMFVVSLEWIVICFVCVFGKFWFWDEVINWLVVIGKVEVVVGIGCGFDVIVL